MHNLPDHLQARTVFVPLLSLPCAVRQSYRPHFEILERELKEKDIRVLREDLLQVSEVGGLLGSALAVRREALPPEAVEFAQSRRPRVEVILKDELEKRLRALLCSKN